MKHTATKLVRETVGGEPYEYYPLGRYVVAAPGVCGGRPTFKYTRLEAAVILDLLASGWTVEQVVHEYAGSHLTSTAVAEAVRLAKDALVATATREKPAPDRLRRK
jgi:uncharacterized protein (DUF433 family)